MRISDWSSDVCSSDLGEQGAQFADHAFFFAHAKPIAHQCIARRCRLAGYLRLFCRGRLLAGGRAGGQQRCRNQAGGWRASAKQEFKHVAFLAKPQTAWGINGGRDTGDLQSRSEEHTSELQSLMRISSAVFCLKKK